ncbi:cytochrome c [Xylophilus sp.]|uniref:cytochrome c n=1 Tax=Xylophilus sp. TaxID=2653893 RepID=UPI0013B628A7|nr:cytochrome c [Xylophilus sp.]KAF1049385.1 MAG: Fructose dehydrogenase cytochrome subunit [Xylophilus sp.]
MKTPLQHSCATAALLALCGALRAMPAMAQTQSLDKPPMPAGAAGQGDRGTLDRGRYLAVAADCAACHTAPRGKPFAGGYGIESPLGTIFATNITPSKTAGIGNYTEPQFARALREGVRADGGRLYPAMPYTSYARMTDEDVHDLYVYFQQGVAPVDAPAAGTRLPFPFNIRPVMALWNLVFVDRKPFQPDPGQSPQVNRGNYLVNGLAHCGTCHTPRNFLMAQRNSAALTGAPLGPWWAPDITADPVHGVGAWSNAELREYLKTGRAEGKGQAAGAMAEAVTNSLQYLRDEDIDAIIAYLRTVPGQEGGRASEERDAGAKPRFGHGTQRSSEPWLRGRDGQSERDSLKTGEALFSGNCASCHAPDGKGSAGQVYPSLSHNTATGAARADNLIAVILYGVERKVGGNEILMPRFDGKSYVNPLSDRQIELIANCVLKEYGNPDVQVTQADVRRARQGGAKPFLARVQPSMAPAMVLAVAALLVWGARTRLRRRRAAARGPGGAPRRRG